MYTEKLVFLAAVVIGLFITDAAPRLFALSGKGVDGGTDGDRIAVRVLAGALVLAAVLVVVVVSALVWSRNPYATAAIALNHPIPLVVALGGATGGAVRWLLRTVDSWTTPAGVLARALPALALFAIGFFGSELRRGYFQITRIDAGGVIIDVNPGASAGEQQIPMFDNNRERVDEYGTDFERGVWIASIALDWIKADLARLEFCGLEHPLFHCPAWNSRTAAFKVRKHFRDASHRLAAFRPVVNCLVHDYAEFFPEGLPIQTSLQRLAESVTIPITEPEKALEGLEKGLQSFVRYRNRFKEPEGDERCSFIDRGFLDYPDQLDYFKAVNVGWCELSAGFRDIAAQKILPVQATSQKYFFTLDNCRENWGPKDAEFKHPLVAVFEAGLITAAGFPSEAAQHLFREHEHYRDVIEAEAEAAPIKAKSFVDFLVQTKFLFIQEFLFDSVGLNERGREISADLVFQYEAFLEPMAKTIEAQPDNLVRWCGDSAQPGRLLDRIRLGDALVGLMADPRVRPRGAQDSVAILQTALAAAPPGDPKSREEAEKYLREVIDTYLTQKLLLARAVSEVPVTRDRLREAHELLATMRDLVSMITDKDDRAAFQRCIAPIYGEDSEKESRRYEFEALAVNGLLNVAVGNAIIDLNASALPNEADSYFCAARRSFERARHIAYLEERSSEETRAVSNDDELLERIRPLARRVNNASALVC